MMKKLLYLMFFAMLLSFQGMSQCGQVSLIGEFNGWNGDLMMTRDMENPDQFTAMLTLKASDDTDTNGVVEMKFRENQDWAVNWGDSVFPSGTAIQNGTNIPVPVGSYVVTFNCSTGAYNFEATCGEIGLIGEFNGWSEDYWMTRDESDPDMWTAYITFSADDDTDTSGFVEAKFRENSDWSVNWGGDVFPADTGYQNGPNIQIPLGNYFVTFNCATGMYDFQSTCGEIGLIGEFNGWSEDYWMTRDADDPDLWTVILTLNADMDASDPADGFIELKFRQNSDWSTNWGGDVFPADTGYQDGPNIMVPLDASGITTDYVVTFNCATGMYNFVSTTGQISMIGAFNGWNGDVNMTRDANDPSSWTLTRSWFEDSEVKFRENADWSVNWGSSAFPSGTGELGSSTNIPLTAGVYDVTFNTSTLAYNFTTNSDACGEIGMVGDFNNWGVSDNTDDPPTDVNLIRDPMYPSQFSLTYNFTSSTDLLFREDADALFENVWGGTFPSGQGVQGTDQYIAVPGGKYKITFNCKSKDFSFTRLGSSVFAPKVFAMSVDGQLNESDWDISQPVSQVVDGTAGTDLNDVMFGLTYNAEYLYVGVKVTDATINSGDVVEIFVDGNKNGGDYDASDVYLKVTSDGTATIVNGPAAIETGVSAGSGAYYVEAGIKWADLGVTPEEGGQIGFDIMVGDDDDGSGVAYTMAWNGGLQDYDGTSGFGDASLGGLSCGNISLFNSTINDVMLRNPTDLPTTYVATYDVLEDFNVVFRKDRQSTVAWGGTGFPSGTATVGGSEIAVPTGRYRITFDCLTGDYSFVDEPAGDSTAYATYTADTATIDGDLSEYSLDYGMDAGVVAGTGPDNNTVTWGTLWDGDYLYIGVKVIDAVVEGSGNPWDNDAIEMYIDGNHDQDGTYDGDFDTQLIMDFADQSTLWIKADGVQLTDYSSNWTATADGYNIELKLGWGDFSFLPGKGRTIGWSIGNNDSDNGIGRDYQTMWYGTGSNWSNTDDLGDLELSGGPYYTVGVKEVNNSTLSNNFRLYPNPSNGEVFLKSLSNNINGNVNISISDITGRTVMNQTVNVQAGSLVQLNTNNLSSGIYIINVISNGKRDTQKLVIE
ncbi:MAG: T9SS type A sorting domain-containing protein [Chlorobi bacterium]|nr:T9SS type A sorting domain-containing protein [Chlorobiota bacterium]